MTNVNQQKIKKAPSGTSTMVLLVTFSLLIVSILLVLGIIIFPELARLLAIIWLPVEAMIIFVVFNLLSKHIEYHKKFMNWKKAHKLKKKERKYK